MKLLLYTNTLLCKNTRERLTFSQKFKDNTDYNILLAMFLSKTKQKNSGTVKNAITDMVLCFTVRKKMLYLWC